MNLRPPGYEHTDSRPRRRTPSPLTPAIPWAGAHPYRCISEVTVCTGYTFGYTPADRCGSLLREAGFPSGPCLTSALPWIWRRRRPQSFFNCRPRTVAAYGFFTPLPQRANRGEQIGRPPGRGQTQAGRVRKKDWRFHFSYFHCLFTYAVLRSRSSKDGRSNGEKEA